MKGESMKLLVIDDNQENLESAKKQLAGHEVTTCNSEKEAYLEYLWCLKKEKAIEFDVLLCDLMLPAGRYTSGDSAELLAGKIHMSGLILCMLAAKHGIKKVGLVTSEWHHKNPVGSLLGDLGRGTKRGEEKHILRVEDSELVINVSSEAEKPWKETLDYLF